MKGVPAPVPFGDPDSATCRWCDGMRARHNDVLLCPRCDSPQLADGEVTVATWAQDSKSSPVDVGDKVRVVRGQFHRGMTGQVIDRDTEDAMGFVKMDNDDTTRAIPLKDLRRVE